MEKAVGHTEEGKIMSKRVSALDATLRALGAGMGEWNDMDVAFTYPTDPNDEHDAVRDAIGIWDASALKKIHVRGPDALATVDHLLTRDVNKIHIGKAAYSPILKDDGHFCDDGYVYHIDKNEFLIAHSIGASNEIEPRHIVVTQLNTFTPVGIAISIVAYMKYSSPPSGMPTVNMWCAQTMNDRKPIEAVAYTIAW